MSGGGDVNADGFDDLLIGARGNDDGPPGSVRQETGFSKPPAATAVTNVAKAPAPAAMRLAARELGMHRKSLQRKLAKRPVRH